MFSWLTRAKIRTPKVIRPEDIEGPVLVKFPGAKGGRGYFIVNSYEEFKQRVGDRKCMIQEFIIGVRAYPHYFFSPFSDIGYKTNNGRLEILGVDKRVESSADEIARAVSIGLKPSMGFTVIGNEPLVLRESLLSDYLDIGKRVSDVSFELFGGLFGPFCVETIITEDLEIYAFEISARIVAGTNVYPDGSPYSLYYYKEPMSTGRRIARELKTAWQRKEINKVVY
jgi:5-formaminoimidazole-4-carboxamide-1-(beta)-D-ribofuranosyl 5'-monophosphate synthetase